MGDDRSQGSLVGPLKIHHQLIAATIENAKAKAASTPVYVMVFGPGKGGGPKYAKRLEIRDRLNQLEGVTAFFPENETISGPIVRDLNLDPDDSVVLEDVLADAVHCIIALEMAEGAVNEVAHYARKPSIAPKILDLIPQKFESQADLSYPGKLRRQLKRHYFTPDEFRDCSIARKICPQHVRGVQFAMLLS